MKQIFRAGTSARACAKQRASATEAALWLLERSVRMGHRRLAVLRLSEAVSTGAAIQDEQWRYCYDIAASSRDPAIRDLYAAAAAAATAKPATTSREHQDG